MPMPRQKIAGLKQIEDRLEILESGLSFGAFLAGVEFGVSSADLRTSLECSGSLTAPCGWWAQWWAHPSNGQLTGDGKSPPIRSARPMRGGWSASTSTIAMEVCSSSVTGRLRERSAD
jgi:hypothetical protein